MILVASVMHTGTVFTMVKLLAGHKDIEQVHFLTKKAGAMTKAIEESEHVIIPLRHPARCLETFKRRSKTYGVYVQQWDNMLERAPSMSAHYVHIDDISRREQDIKKLGGLIKGEVDWTPSIDAGMVTHTYDLTITDEMIDEIPKQYIEFYKAVK